jgi:hypothetical protein
MSYPPSTPETPAGWYPDPSGTGRQRWWDGRGWTEHYEAAVSEPAGPVSGSGAGHATANHAGINPSAVYAPVGAPRKVQPGTPVYTPFIWLIVLLPLLPLIALAFWDMDAYMRNSVSSASDPFAQFKDVGYLLLQALSFLVYAASVLLAFFDFKTLTARGFDRPFHWAWAFLGGTVYIIGRSVVANRRAGKALLPIWILIGVFVISLIISTVKVIGAVSSMMSSLDGVY